LFQVQYFLILYQPNSILIVRNTERRGTLASFNVSPEIWILDGRKMSALCCGCFIPGKTATYIVCVGGWVSSRRKVRAIRTCHPLWRVERRSTSQSPVTFQLSPVYIYIQMLHKDKILYVKGYEQWRWCNISRLGLVAGALEYWESEGTAGNCEQKLIINF
jgi:hypothetical protein